MPGAPVAGRREAWELEGLDAHDADHVTTDLVGFLQQIATRP